MFVLKINLQGFTGTEWEMCSELRDSRTKLRNSTSYVGKTWS